MEQESVPYELIGRFLSGEATEKEVDALKTWRESAHKCEQKFQLIAAAWGSSFNEEQAFQHKEEEAFLAVEQMIGRQERFFGNYWLKMAAILFVVIGVAITYHLTQTKKTTHFVSIATKKGEKKSITLSDGTEVWLNESTELRYQEPFDNERKVILKGEAYFDVVADEKKPFIVAANTSYTRVLGTAFNIKTESDKVSIMVTEGAVAFSSTIRPESTSKLQSGKAAVLNTSTNRVEKMDNIDPNVIAWKTGRLVFKMSSLEEVAMVLGSYYKVNIYVEPQDAQKLLTTVFDNDSLEVALKVLCVTLDLEVEYKDAKSILIRSK